MNVVCAICRIEHESGMCPETKAFKETYNMGLFEGLDQLKAEILSINRYSTYIPDLVEQLKERMKK